MKLRTRVAFMAILFLVGWILASPHYRNSSHQKGSASPSPPLLQLQRAPTPMPLVAPQASNSVLPLVDTQVGFPGPRERFQPADLPPTPMSFDPAKRLTSGPTTPSPIPTGMVPVPMHPSESPERRLKPVTLVVSQVGAELVPEPRDLQKERTDTGVAPPSAAKPSEPEAEPERRPNAEKPQRRRLQRHRIVNGDSLESIAREYLGSPRHALKIYETNRDLLVSPTILPLGVELYLPARPPATAE